MGRGRKATRRQAVRLENSDEGSIDEPSGSTIDPQVALQLADLSNNARDRLTAHDIERDRQVDFAQLNRSRKCNQRGTAEAQNATDKQTQLSGWNSFGGTDSTTNLDDIGRGQYHRAATSLKVQAETRQLRIEGKELIADSIDTPRMSSSHRGNGPLPVRGRNREQNLRNPTKSIRPLDPAIDSNRACSNKTGAQYASEQATTPRGQGAIRGGRVGQRSGRGGHSAQLGRQSVISTHTTVSETSIPSSAPPTVLAVRDGLGARAIKQRHNNDRPVPALMCNPAPTSLPRSILSLSPSQFTTEESTSSRSIVSQNIPPPQVQAEKMAIQSNGALKMQVSAQDASPAQPANTGSNPTFGRGRLAEDFGSWIKAAGFSTAAPLGPVVASTSRLTQPNNVNERESLMIPRNELTLGVTIPHVKESDENTDGYLSNPDLSDEFDDDSHASAEDAVRVNEGTAAPIVSSQSAVPFRQKGLGLLDTEIPQDESKALNLFQAQEQTSGRENPFKHPDQRDRSSSGMRIRGLADHNIKTNTSFVTNSGEHFVKPVDSIERPAGTDASVRNSRYASTSPLRPRSSNTIAYNSAVGTKPSTTNTGQQIGQPAGRGHTKPPDFAVSSGNLAGSLLGDCSNRFLRAPASSTVSNALQQSRYADTQSKPVPSSGIKRTQAGPGFEQLLRDLAEKNITISTARRPDEPALTKATQATSFTQYREPVPDASASDDDDEL